MSSDVVNVDGWWLRLTQVTKGVGGILEGSGPTHSNGDRKNNSRAWPSKECVTAGVCQQLPVPSLACLLWLISIGFSYRKVLSDLGKYLGGRHEGESLVGVSLGEVGQEELCELKGTNTSKKRHGS